MAGNKLNTKTKTKDDRTKPNKNLSSTNEETEDLDCTILRKPILTSITGFAQARKVFDLATEELKSLLTNECDILYECKVCRNIFRSLANFISHKRIYCKEQFDNSVHGHFVRTLSAASEISRIKKLEQMYNDSLKDEDGGILNQKYDDRIPLTKDLTEILERLAVSRGKRQEENPEVVLQKIPKSNVAVFQSIKDEDDTVTDLMKAQVRELNMMMSRENAVLNDDGSFEVQSSLSTKKAKETESIIQISDDENNEDGADILKCKICDLQFSTQKTLKFHMKYKHLESRLVYPCPDCLEIFSTSWSVYRHLFKVHRKTAAQIRRLRESIQAKAFRMNNPPAFYEKRKNTVKNTTPQKITEEERIDQENQAWMDNLEGDGEVPRCGGCGRTFERRAALAAHTHTCQPRSRALARRPPDPRKIEIQIRKDYNKAPPPLTLPLKIAESKDKQTYEKTPDQKIQKEKEKAPEPMEEEQIKESTQVSDSTQTDESMVETLINKSKLHEIVTKLPFARQTEKNNFNSFIKRCEPDMDVDKLLCKKCDNKFTKVTDLHDHMAEHYKWLRYACKLCNYKHFSFEKLPEHVKIVHKLKGDTDFYYSTVKAIDATEALQLSEFPKDTNDSSETSPNSRRPSRCSSDSSRLSDDSSSSSTRVEGTRKRKTKYNKVMSKRKKEEMNEDIDGQKDSEASNDMLDESYSSNVKVFEENSSDIDEVEEKTTKKSQNTSSTQTLTSRRPVRKRTNKKNEDFEYDLSNLLKMEAQGYRDSQTVVPAKPVVPPKVIPTKKKIPVENQNNNVFRQDKDYSGALAALSKKAVAICSAHLKCSIYTHSDARATSIFLRPLLPKVARLEKVSPKKDTQQVADLPSVKSSTEKDMKPNPPVDKDMKDETSKPEKQPKTPEEENLPKKDTVNSIDEKSPTEEKVENNVGESSTPKLNVPTVVPLKLRRQSLDLMKNPLIKKNITDFSKAGMKTKILVIKPINRNNQDGGKTINTPLKFQTIKLKDPNKSSPTSEVKLSDQVRVVQVPKVDRALTLPVSNTSIKNDANLSTTGTNTTSDVKVDSINTATTCDEKLTENKCDKDTLNKEVSEDPIPEPEVLNSTNSEKDEPPTKDNISSANESLPSESNEEEIAIPQS